MLSIKRLSLSLILALVVAVVGLTVIGVGDAQAALGYHSGFETGDFAEGWSITGSSSVYESDTFASFQEYTDDGTIRNDIWGDYWYGQTFTTTKAHTVSAVSLRLSKYGSPADDLYVGIKTVDGSSHPTGSDLTSGSIGAASVSTTEAWTNISLTPYSLSASTMYAIVLSSPSCVDGSNCYRWGEGATSGYGAGAQEISIDGGSSWNTEATPDMTFQEGYVGFEVRTGDYAMRCNPTGASAYVDSPAVSGRRCSFYLYIATAPDDTETITQFWEGGSSGTGITLSSTRYLTLVGVNTPDTGSTQLNVEQWYRICLCVDETNTDAKVFLDGLEECAATDAFSANQDSIRSGVCTTGTADLYFDDVVIDSTEGLTDLGDIRVLRSVPIADSVTHDDWKDTTDGAITYDDVDEVTASTADWAWFESNGVLNQQTWTTTTMTTLGIDGMTLNAISSWFYYTTGGGGANEYYTYMRDNGTDYSTGIDDPKIATWVGRYDAVMPNGGGAWTEARVDAYEIGMATDDANKDIWCYAAYKMIAYTYSVGGEADIVVAPDTKNYGIVLPSQTLWSNGSEPTWPLVDGDAYFTITNNGDPCSITIVATNLVGTVTWTLGVPAENVARLTAFKEGDGSGDGVALTTSPQAFISGLTTDIDIELKLETPTTFDPTDGSQKTSTITLAATLD